MKATGKLTLLALCLLGASVVEAQTQAQTKPQTVIDLAAYVDDQTAAQIGESNTTALQNKISKIITRNGMADAAGFFAVVPTITVTDDGTVDTGMASIRVLRADFTLSIVNLMEGTTFGSQTVALQANGKSDEACMRSLINRVNVNDVRFAKMIRDAQQDIADYYARMMPRLMARVDSFIAQGAYEDAMAALAMVPDNVAEYETAARLKVEIYNKMLSDEVTRSMAEADIRVRQGDIDGALALCRNCDPLSPNYGEVLAFLRRLDAEAAKAEAQALEAKMRKLDAAARKEQVARQADVQGKTIKAERAETSRKKGKSLGAFLLGL